MNMTISANTYYEKLPRKWSNYFQEEYEKIRTDDAHTLGARIEFLKKKVNRIMHPEVYCKRCKKWREDIL